MRCTHRDESVIRAEARIEAINEVLALPSSFEGSATIWILDIEALLHPTVTYEVTATWQTTPPDFPEPELGSPT